MNIIEIEKLGKKYTIKHEYQSVYRYTALRDVIADGTKNIFKSLLGKKCAVDAKEEIWVLKDVSFDVKQGERLGIIGRNGAGKSTLLKILSRITEPSEGVAVINGRISSLLEVGTGFHPELTGRENIYLNGSILGMKKKEIEKNFDEIVDFSGVEKFLDTPVKRYSSGMQVRLAFSVAAHLEPEILLIDEVLAVGDMEFQKKCLSKMDEVSKKEGRTILFVSHNMQAISSLCNKAILLKDGLVESMGTTSHVIANYFQSEGENLAFVDYTRKKIQPGDNLAILLNAWIENHLGEKTSDIMMDKPFRICMKYRILQDVPEAPYPNFHIFDNHGQYVFVTSPNKNTYKDSSKAGEYISVCEIPENFFNNDIYSIGLALTFTHSGTHVSFFENNALFFSIIERLDNAITRPSGYSGRIPGVIRPELKWELKEIQ